MKVISGHTKEKVSDMASSSYLSILKLGKSFNRLTPGALDRTRPRS